MHWECKLLAVEPLGNSVFVFHNNLHCSRGDAFHVANPTKAQLGLLKKQTTMKLLKLQR
jgi:hypothetical protein